MSGSSHGELVIRIAMLFLVSTVSYLNVTVIMVMKLSSENGLTPSGCTQLDAGDFDDLGLTKFGKKLVLKYLMRVPAEERATFNSFMSQEEFFKWLMSWGVSDKDCNTLSGKFSLIDDYLKCYCNNYNGDGIILREWCYSTWVYSARCR